MKTPMSHIQAILLAGVAIWSGELTVMQAGSAEKTYAPTEHTDTYALIVSGINKDPNDRLAKEQVVMNLRSFFLNNARLKPEQVCLLTTGDSALRESTKISTAENLREALTAFAAKIQPADRFVFYYAGQANTVASQLRLNLPGEDITHRSLAEWINQIKASSMMIVLDCPGAGLAAKALTGAGRVVICGCESEQHYSTKLGEYFVPVLTDPNSDTDNNGKVSVLEAFTLACRQIEDWYRQRNLLKTETPVLEDNADGTPSPQPWRLAPSAGSGQALSLSNGYESDKGDGLLASQFFLVGEPRHSDGGVNRLAPQFIAGFFGL